MIIDMNSSKLDEVLADFEEHPVINDSGEIEFVHKPEKEDKPEDKQELATETKEQVETKSTPVVEDQSLDKLKSAEKERDLHKNNYEQLQNIVMALIASGKIQGLGNQTPQVE